VAAWRGRCGWKRPLTCPFPAACSEAGMESAGLSSAYCLCYRSRRHDSWHGTLVSFGNHRPSADKQIVPRLILRHTVLMPCSLLKSSTPSPLWHLGPTTYLLPPPP
jgi:hypothetical protein